MSFLVNMYVNCAVDGSVDASMRVFDQMLMHDVMSWTAIITGYVQSGGRDKEAIELFCSMKQEGVQPNQFTFASVLKACANLSDADLGEQAMSFYIYHRGDISWTEQSIDNEDDPVKNLYNANVRKVVIMGLAPLGCNPHYLWEYNSKGGLCVSEINDMVIAFNFAMREMVDELHRELPDAKITFCDVFEGAMDILQNCQHYGFETITDACCGLGQYGGLIMCISPEMACANASKHVWWDQFHPTGAVNAIIADSVWSGLHANICYPMNLQDMVP
ncbi:hypothetical protein ACLOJK_035612 [Asimina triloba]